jgi:hypothetical protein
MRIKGLDLSEYLPMKNPTQYKMPYVKAYSFRSTLYHEKMIENIVLTSLNKVAYSNQDKGDKIKVEGTSEGFIDKLVKRTDCKMFI